MRRTYVRRSGEASAATQLLVSFCDVITFNLPTKGDSMIDRKEWLARINADPGINLVFASYEHALGAEHNPKLYDVRGIAALREAIRVVREDGPLLLMLYLAGFNQPGLVEDLKQSWCQGVEKNCGGKFDFLIPETWLGIPEEGQDVISQTLTDFAETSLFHDQSRRHVLFIDDRIPEDEGWEYKLTGSRLSLLEAPDRRPVYGTCVGYEESQGPGSRTVNYIEAATLQALQQALKQKQVRRVSLKSRNAWDDVKTHVSGIEVDALTEQEYRWLTRCMSHQDRYLSF